MKKHERLEEDVKRALSKIISEELKNPKIEGMISVTDVKITPDQKYAKVFVSIFNVKNKDRVLEGLKNAKGFIADRLSKNVKLRNIPEIIFALDSSIEYGMHMNKIINELNNK